MSFIYKYLPTCGTEDPFAKYRPFPANPQSILAAHWHEILGSFIFYLVVQALSGPIFSRIMGPRYTKLPKRTRINFDVHVTSMVQCCISISLLVPHLSNEHWANRLSDPANSLVGTTPFGAMVCAVTVGYFVWDIYVCTKYFALFGFGFLFHGFAAAYAFGAGLVPYCQPWAGAFLAFELSTPFVNMNWFASKLPAGTFSERTIIINGLCLIISFFLVRIVWGFYAVYMLAMDMFATWDLVPSFLPISMLTLNFSLDVLNVFWFSKMIMIAKKKASGKESTRQAAHEAEKIE
ncbi:Topoisomerase I damage affected protein 4 [Spathaspora sp. JA1]|nr:Topoisomerase I damage affected protein 4 [Spathaspora sp. JA1]